MRYYPVFLDISKRACVVVGGGAVAERKVLSLLAAGALVKVISPRLVKGLQELEKEGSIEAEKRRYRPGDIEGAFLVVSAASGKAVNRAVYEEAQLLRIPINVVDDPIHCSFIVPSVVERGGLLIAISTSGKSPYLARRLREELEGRFGEEYSGFVEILGAVRSKLLKNPANHVKKERVIKELVDSPIPRWIRENAFAEIDRFLKNLLGSAYTLSRLGVRPDELTTKKIK